MFDESTFSLSLQHESEQLPPRSCVHMGIGPMAPQGMSQKNTFS